jgi:chitodextrinase
MSVRRAVRALSLLALALVVTSTAGAARDRQAPTQPKNLRLTASTPTSVSLAWDASSDNSTTWYYCVKLGGQGCFRVDPPRTTFTHPKLWPDRTYEWTVVAQDTAGNRSAPSNTVVTTTPPDVTPPSPAPVLTATAVFPNRVSLSWTSSTDNVSQVFYSLFKDGTPVVGGGLSATIDNLLPATTYEFQVEARDWFGNAVRSEVLAVTTAEANDAVPPTAPTNLRLSSETIFPEIWLDWNQSTDNLDPQSQLVYDVYINGVFDHTTFGRGDTATYCLVEGGSNEIVVRARDTSGNVSGPSNTLRFECV